MSRAGTHSKVTNGGPFCACLSNVLRRRLVAAALPLTEAALRQPLRRYQGPCQAVTNHLVLMGGLEIPDSLLQNWQPQCHRFMKRGPRN